MPERYQHTPAEITVHDSGALDAFSRLRVSNPQGLFDAQFTYNLRPLEFEAVAANGGSGTATVAHDSTNRCALMTFTGAANTGTAYMQSYEYVRYQPGRSQAAFVTFNFIETATNVLKFAGLSDGANGVELQLDGTTVQLKLYSDTANGDQTVAQANWNIDLLDGTGPSRKILDLTKTQILVIDLQALYVGRVRVGFDIDGVIVYVHEFLHANRVAAPYIQYASLPIRCGMTASGAATTTMRFVCCAVVSEGGQEENGGLPTQVEGTITAASGVDTHILSIRPRTTFNSLTNRTKVALDSIDVIVTGNQPVLWKLVVGQALTTPTFAAVNTTYSSMEALAGAGTLSGTPVITLLQGYVGASATQKGSANVKIASAVPITLTAAGLQRDLGTLTVLVQGVGGTSATRVNLNWRELR
jgi:hypothetical protein